MDFRVRRTDDITGKWTVANSNRCVTTTFYVLKDGTGQSKTCEEFDTEAEAQAALDLYKTINHVNQTLADGEAALKKVYGHPRFYEIIEQMKELHSRKNHDYAGTSDPLKNLRACERLRLKPFMGVMVRLQDKWSRLEEFVKSGKLMVKGESVIDTLMDNAVYSVLAIILYEEQQKEENYAAAIDHETGESKPGYGGKIDRTKPTPGGF